MCCVDAEDYAKLPLGQYEEDNVLRELNKCLLAYQQKQSQPTQAQTQSAPAETQHQRAARRLSPIGESLSLGSNTEVSATINIPLIKEESCSTNRSGSRSPTNNNLDGNKLSVQLEYQLPRHQPKFTTNEAILNNRRGKFIVLGSSGECLPVKRRPLGDEQSKYSSCSDDDDDEFHSAKTSIEDEYESEDEEFHKRYSMDLETPERRHTFAERLREALRREASNFTSSSESGYAVGINITGASIADQDIK